MADRGELGKENVGEPIWELRHAVSILGHTEFEAVRMDAVDYYFEKFLMGFLPELIDDAVSDEKLAQLSPELTKQLAFLLLGDFIRRLHGRLAAEQYAAANPAWHERLVRRIADLIKLPTKPFVEHALRGPAEDIEKDLVIARLSAKMGISVAKLFVVQPAMVEVVEEDVLSRRKRR